jgi:hypothetical protein
MDSDILLELTQDIKKLYALEQSIIDGDHEENSELRSKQALLVSEVIQSLQKLKDTLKTESQFLETQFTMTKQHVLS